MPIAVPVGPVAGAQDEDGFDQSPDSGNDRSDEDDPSDQGQQQLSHGLAGISQIEVVHAEGAEEQAEQAGDDLRLLRVAIAGLLLGRLIVGLLRVGWWLIVCGLRVLGLSRLLIIGGLRRLCVIRRSVRRLAVDGLCRLRRLSRLPVSGSGRAICGDGRTVSSRLTIWLTIAIRTAGDVVALRTRGISLHGLLRCVRVGIVRL